MKRIEDCGYDYAGLIESFEVTVLISGHKHDYQGDSYYIFRDGDRYGYLIFGWGSCSGCDAYMAARESKGMKALYELRDSLWNSVKWFESFDGVVDYIADKDDGLEWYGYDDGYAEFKKSVVEYCLLGE